jgi:hypothetical protein
LKKTFQSSCIEHEEKNEKVFLAQLHPFSAPCNTLKNNLFCCKNVATPLALRKKVVISQVEEEFLAFEY